MIAPYQATGPEQLSLQPGQLIDVRKKNPSGWWEGELQVRSVNAWIIILLVIGPILWGHSGPLCHTLSLLSSSSSLSWTSMHRQRAACDSSDTWWMGMRWLAVANGPNILKMLLVILYYIILLLPPLCRWEPSKHDLEDWLEPSSVSVCRLLHCV